MHYRQVVNKIVILLLLPSAFSGCTPESKVIAKGKSVAKQSKPVTLPPTGSKFLDACNKVQLGWRREDVIAALGEPSESSKEDSDTTLIYEKSFPNESIKVWIGSDDGLVNSVTADPIERKGFKPGPSQKCAGEVMCIAQSVALHLTEPQVVALVGEPRQYVRNASSTLWTYEDPSTPLATAIISFSDSGLVRRTIHQDLMSKLIKVNGKDPKLLALYSSMTSLYKQGKNVRTPEFTTQTLGVLNVKMDDLCGETIR